MVRLSDLNSTVRIISIHAPAKGATRDRVLCWTKCEPYAISIHAPVKGATRDVMCVCMLQNCCNFNPRSREGSDDHDRLADCHCSEKISIHAPAKGATLSSARTGELSADISIHAPAKGATPAHNMRVTKSGQFQSTLPRRERHDRPVCTTVLVRNISIHAPAKGATCNMQLVQGAG